jgi:hypothetical protein
MMIGTDNGGIISCWNHRIASREKSSYHLLTRAYTSGYELVQNLTKILPCKVVFWILGEMRKIRNVENEEISKTP